VFVLGHIKRYTLCVRRIEQDVKRNQAACTSTHPRRVERGQFERKFKVDVHERDVSPRA